MRVGAVLVVDDQPLVHEVLRVVVRAALPGVTVIFERSIANAALRVAAVRRIQFALLDLVLPGCSGIDALRKFRESFKEVPVAIVSANVEGATVRAAFEAGAIGYLPKTMTPKSMAAALRVIAEGGSYVPREALQDLPARAERAGWGVDCLTGRQVEILRLLVHGASNREIGRQLGITESTVKQHTHAVYLALGVANRTEAAIAAERGHLNVA